MRFSFAAIGATVAIMAATLFAPQAEARMAAPALAVPSQVEQVACRVVRDRVVRPGGRVVTTTRRVCTPGPVVVGPRRAVVVGPRGGCRTIKERTVRPNGTVVVRSVRRC